MHQKDIFRQHSDFTTTRFGVSLFVFLFFPWMCLQISAQEKNLLAKTPPMGWNSWNWFGKNGVNEEKMKQCMDAIVEEGLLDAGYKYFVIDGGWRDKKLSPNGELIPHPKKFPNGIKALADYAHARGLKFGLHTVPGTHDCGGDAVGGFGHEEIQFQQFIEWGIDFIKLDKCNHENGWDDATFKQTYYKWHRLIRNEKRNILLSISARHPDNEWQEWFPEIGQMARTTDDIKAKVSGGAVFDHIPHRSVMRIAEENSRWAEYAGNGYWNDPDFLAIRDQGLTIEEQKVHFALWCIMSAPLILGNDPRNMTPEEKNLITNKWAIAINQDPDEQGGRIKKVGAKEIWAKKLTNGDLALLLLNRGDKKTIKIKISPKELEFSEKAIVREIFSDEEIGIVGKSFSKKIEPHNGLFLLLHKPK